MTEIEEDQHNEVEVDGTADHDKLLEALNDQGGGAGNKTLREMLGWNGDKYWPAQQDLIDKGLVQRGRGKGGSISLTNPQMDGGEEPQERANEEANLKPLPAEIAPRPMKETDYYGDLKEQIEKNWLPSQGRGQDNSIVRITADMGRAFTGGTWTRPDLSVVTVRAFEYLPDKVMDLISFEIKVANDIGVMGVYEAVSHAKSATISYVLFLVNRDAFDKAQEAPRIVSACKEHGIGLILAETADDHDSWEEVLEPVRVLPEPQLLNDFIKMFFDDAERSDIARWIR